MHRASYRFMPPCGITETLSDVESVRVVHGESYCPEEIADRSICIDGDIGEVFETQIL